MRQGELLVIVGIPKTLAFYSYYPLWKTFLEGLGVKTLLSRPTNREILEWGIRDTVTDACIPIKILHGHVIDLKDRVDFLFIPRMVSVDGRAVFCPKFLGLPDMVRYSGAKLPPVIDSKVESTRFRSWVLPFFRDVARRLRIKAGPGLPAVAYRACQRQRTYRQLLLAGMAPLKAMQYLDEKQGAVMDRQKAAAQGGNKSGKGLKVALLGYPYVLYDPFISSNLYRKLEEMGVEPVTPERVPLSQLRSMSRILPQNFFWHYSNRVAWSCLYYLDEPGRVDGIIHVTAFGCGPDAMVDKFVELEAKQKKTPFLTLTIDEHTGEGGLHTRLEAFVDMLLARKESLGKGGE